MKRKCIAFVVTLILTVLPILNVFDAFAVVIDEETLYYYGLNGIYHYNKNGTEKRGSSSDCDYTTGGNQNYAGETVWSDAELSAIEENQPVYERVASQHGFPWQVLAVLHSMETGLRRYNPANGQGVYQLYAYTSGGTNGNRFEPASSISEEEFERQTSIAAEVVTSMVGDLNNKDNVKRLFFMYNGVAAKYVQKALDMGFSLEEAENGEGSVYVMNRYDAKRDPASAEMSSYWPGRYVADGVYDQNSTSMVFGAFVKYEALYGGSSNCSEEGGGNGGGGGNGSIVETAMLLSWDGHGHSKDDPKPEYVQAMKEVGTYFAPCRSSGDCAPIGASCDVFVSTVMRYSGSDSDFPVVGPVAQEQHMATNTDMYTKVEASDISDLQAGDILVATDNGRHIYLYLGDGMQASASYDDRTGEHFMGVYLTDSGTGNGARHYNVYRRTS